MSDLDSVDTLAHLSAYEIDIDSNDFIGRRLPFGSLDRHQLRKALCLPVELGSPDFGHRQLECRSIPKGNYMASATLAELRITRAKLGVQRPRRLERVLELPHELVFEIFEYLHPIDLYHMTCATKSLRSFLLDRRTALVWEKAFFLHPSVPGCPDDVSFPKWASLLFGPATCDKCGYPNVLVDFAFRKRLCQICMSAKHKSRDSLTWLVYAILGDYSEAHEDLWELVRYTRRTSSFVYYDHQMVQRYLEEDVRERAQELKAFLRAIESGEANAQEKYQTFKNKTVASTLVSRTHVIVCNRWAARHFFMLEQDLNGLIGRFADICRRRLLALGYDQRDVSNIRGLPQYLYSHCKRTSSSRFARKDYRSHLPSLEKMVLLAKNERLAVEYAQRVEARREEVAAFYHDTTAYIDPAHWQHLPKVQDIQQLAPFVEYIRNDLEPSEKQGIPVDAGRSAILGFVDNWIKEKKLQLCEILEKARPGATTQALQRNPVEVLNLATAVFVCRLRVSIHLDPTPCPAIIGWDAVGPHLFCAENQVYVTHQHTTYEKALQFCEDGYRTVIQLLGLLDLDPLVTTARDLDTLNLRFICNTSAPTVELLTWRECVNHVSRVRTFMPNPPELSFSVLTEEATRSVIHHEPLYPYPGDAAWSCRRCTEHLKNPTTRKAVVSHLQLVHGIWTSPVENIDFFYVQPTMPPERKRFYATQEEGILRRCMRCAHPLNLRIWTWNISVLQHLKHKHKILEPVVGVDFTVMTLIRKRLEH